MKHFKLLAIGLLAFQLSACATVSNIADKVVGTVQTIVTPNNLDTVEAAYGSALAIAIGYRNLCERKVINKSCWNIIAKVQPYEAKAYNAVIVLRRFVMDNPTLDASSFYQIANDAISSFKSIQIQLGVK